MHLSNRTKLDFRDTYGPSGSDVLHFFIFKEKAEDINWILRILIIVGEPLYIVKEKTNNCNNNNLDPYGSFRSGLSKSNG